MTHIFWRCSEVNRVWRLLSTSLANPSCTDATILEWVCRQILCSGSLVPIALWEIWKMRNETVFQNDRVSPMMIINRISQL
uniref:Reverse transcriptase zinc-binding domain-containing protein n=1 Tax=Cajanus cajan TaxID=3821 RepID=A0A151RS63_CAJCA|nr:hypothetical protein KK1_033081 [Cajanus cajan]